MKILTEADGIIKKILGKQEYEKEGSYRLLSWCAYIKTGKETLLHNYMTGKTFVMEEGENHYGVSLRNELVADWFVVPEDTDDTQLLEQLRSAMKLFDYKKAITSYKILTTTDCNARCFYCYEAGIKKEDMSPETAERVAEFIKQNHEDSDVTLAWFGGEPLMNTDVIDIICTGLKKERIKYASVMTSNGYLFDSELIKKAAGEWHLKNIQITLDGTRDNYNKIKSYCDVEDNPYERVLNNIDALAAAGVRVNIRLNMGVKNHDDIMKLIDELGERFGGNENVSAYVSGLFQETERKDTALKKELSEKLIMAAGEIDKKGLNGPKLKNVHTRTGGCMADNDNHIGISPGGALMKCEHHIYDKLVGSLDDGIDDSVTDIWKKRMPEGRLCGTCPVKPVCYRLERCPVSHPCDEYEQNEYILRKESQIIKNYELINLKGAKNRDLTEVSGDENC